MKNVLKILKKELENMNIPYTFDEWDKDYELPQFIGEILETPTIDEDGLNEHSFILTGYSKTYDYLFNISDKLKNKYKTSKIVDGITIKYDDTITISNDIDDLKQIQITFKIKDWSVIS